VINFIVLATKHSVVKKQRHYMFGTLSNTTVWCIPWQLVTEKNCHTIHCTKQSQKKLTHTYHLSYRNISLLVRQKNFFKFQVTIKNVSISTTCVLDLKTSTHTPIYITLFAVTLCFNIFLISWNITITYDTLSTS